MALWSKRSNAGALDFTFDVLHSGRSLHRDKTATHQQGFVAILPVVSDRPNSDSRLSVNPRPHRPAPPQTPARPWLPAKGGCAAPRGAPWRPRELGVWPDKPGRQVHASGDPFLGYNPSTLPTTVGERIAYERVARGWSRKRLADEAFVDEATVRRIEEDTPRLARQPCWPF